jgi:hypothetical protein
MKYNMTGAPYFYLSPYPNGRDLQFKNVPAGNWKWEKNSREPF